MLRCDLKLDVAEILQRTLNPADRFLLLASDGLFEHISSQKCVEVLQQYRSLRSGCHALVELAYREWLQKDGRCDDITIVAVRIDGLDDKREVFV